MPPADASNIEDYKNELKQCLRENIMHKREIKHLRNKKKDIEDLNTTMQKEIDELKSKSDLDV